MYMANMAVDDIDYYFELISRQKSGVQDAINHEMGLV